MGNSKIKLFSVIFIYYYYDNKTLICGNTRCKSRCKSFVLFCEIWN